MKTSIDIKLVVIYLWIAVAYLFLGIINGPHEPAGIMHVVFNNIWSVIYVTILNFIFLEYTIPFVLKKRTYLIYNLIIGVLLLWVHLMFYSFGSYAWQSLGRGLSVYTTLKTPASVSQSVQKQMAYSAGSIFFFGIIRHLYNYAKLKQTSQQLRIEKQQAELNYLKSQTNPHFLFNTLNNIYSLARDKSDKAPESILRLSKMLRFMLYETSGDYIGVEQELKIISDYIALEKLRYDESLRINFNYDVEDMKQALPPLLLIPLVENSFKHGVSETRGLPFVDIHLSIKRRRLDFVVKNSSEALPGEQTISENIGLSNLRRQLELLFTDYSLTVKQEKSVFTAHLQINLASHV